MQLSFHILIVDDVSENIQVAMNILREEATSFRLRQMVKKR